MKTVEMKLIGVTSYDSMFAIVAYKNIVDYSNDLFYLEEDLKEYSRLDPEHTYEICHVNVI